MVFADPKNDLAFKKIFGDQSKSQTLIGFLNTMLELPSPIESIQIATPYQVPDIKELKNTLLDVLATDEKGRQFVVEMQVESDESFGKRAIYYTAKNYVNQIKVAEEYRTLKPVYFLGILNFNLFDGASPITRHIIINQEEGRHDLKELEWNFVELQKFTKKEENLESIVDKWIFFFNNAENLEVIPRDTNDLSLESAYNTASTYTWSKEELRVYDHMGLQKGSRKNALEDSFKNGKQEGREEGERDALSKVVLKMRREGCAGELISSVTGLTCDELQLL